MHYRYFRKSNGVFYSENSETRQQASLKTRIEAEAKRLIQAKNDALQSPNLNLALGKTYLAAHDPNLVSRTWADVMKSVLELPGRDTTKTRRQRAFDCPAFDAIRTKPLGQTTADEILVIARTGSATNLFMKILHNHAHKMGWLPWPLVPQASWPKAETGSKRAITREEHDRILALEKNPEWRDYLELLWEVGASQSDGANLTSENIVSGALVYHRQKLKAKAPPAVGAIGTRLSRVLARRPTEGLLFPNIAAIDNKTRAFHFYRMCKRAGVEGVSLHSYRYAWAERGFKAGYPERWAKANLGHNSSAVHHAYSKKAEVIHPALEDYEKNIIPMPKESSG